MIRIQQFIAILIVTGSAFAIVNGSDRFFPFSNYPMYSKLFPTPETYNYRGVRVVMQDGSDDRLKVRRELSPFWMASFREALLVDRSDPALTAKLRATLMWYKQRLLTRAGFEATATQVQSIRLYRYELPWTDLTNAAIKNEALDQAFREHAVLQLEVTP